MLTYNNESKIYFHLLTSTVVVLQNQGIHIFPAYIINPNSVHIQQTKKGYTVLKSIIQHVNEKIIIKLK